MRIITKKTKQINSTLNKIKKMFILFNQKREFKYSHEEKTIFKKSSKKNPTNFINDSNDFDNIDKKSEIDHFIFVNDKKNQKKSLNEVDFDMKQNISKNQQWNKFERQKIHEFDFVHYDKTFSWRK